MRRVGEWHSARQAMACAHAEGHCLLSRLFDGQHSVPTDRDASGASADVTILDEVRRTPDSCTRTPKPFSSLSRRCTSRVGCGAIASTRRFVSRAGDSWAPAPVPVVRVAEPSPSPHLRRRGRQERRAGTRDQANERANRSAMALRPLSPRLRVPVPQKCGWAIVGTRLSQRVPLQRNQPSRS